MTTGIEHDYNVALDILKPTRRDLEHGLDLHKEALVVESYGLGLHAPVDEAELDAAMQAGATAQELQDKADDMRFTGWLRDSALREEYQRAWQASGVSCVFQNAGREGNEPLRQIKRLAHHTFVTDSMPEFLRRASTPADIIQARKDGKCCVYLTTNGVPLAGDLVSPTAEMRYIRVFAQLGVRMMHLTYNRRNLMADGCIEDADAGLSDFGREVVREMNRQGVIVDLAHTGSKSSIEAAQASAKPVVISHATVHKLCGHPRGKSEAVMRAVVDTGGTMGITNVPAFLGGSGDLRAFLNHIDYVVKAFGAGAVTIGTDRAFKSARTSKTTVITDGQPSWENFWPSSMPGGEPLDAPLDKRPRQLASLNWTNWPLFTVGLVQRGHSDEDIRKIIGGNILRVAQAVWPPAQPPAAN